MTTELRLEALAWLCECHPETKAEGVIALSKQVLTIDATLEIKATQSIPGRPAKPGLVSPLTVEKRSMRTIEGRATLIHALAHIEFNAINLALDAIWRFAHMPETYYRDWLKVAAEEAYHFNLLNAHLTTMGYTYGDFSGHNSLWEMVERTQEDVLARMALVPRTMEARGLDASPALRNKLAQAGDTAAAEILDIILRDEIGHVAIGNYWFNWLCGQRKLNAIATYEALCQQFSAPKLRPPFNIEARRKAGFSEEELSRLN
ncbi:MAG: ferritin-like domain-containing protein [Methylophilus sp.]|nr:ferritin-like domain-containing protein [Methylophilus sp.]